ncbi:hypothetical protein [Priestia megaterium]|uniref:hypothetical protein n=1 Tax=Priestia megaterium TaxID=1404 RepID=UPI003CC5DB0E
MADGLLSGLLFAWVLSWFGFDNLAVKGINELLQINATTASYYLIAVALGIIAGLLNDIIKIKKGV